MGHDEHIIESTLSNKVKIAGGLCIKLLPFFFAGLPDRLVLLPLGQIFFVETKSAGKTPEKIQLAVHKKLRNLGFSVYIIDNIADIQPIIDKYTSVNLR